jgi:hypothetical protein
LAKHDQLLRGVYDLGQCAPHGAPRADAEQAFGRRIEERDEQVLVEDDERRRKTLQDVVGFRRSTRASTEAGTVSGAGGLAPLPA